MDSGPKSLLDGIRIRLEALPDARTVRRTAATLFVASCALFLVYIQFPEKLNFDEFHYIPAARRLLEFTSPKNLEHPPLGKELIAIGMAIFGDRPLGWRFMSTIFGALTVTGTYVAGLALFRTQLSALFLALMTAFNNMTYVQARIAMLDTFMTGFLVWAFALGLGAFFPLHPESDPEADRRARLRSLNLSGLAIGLACASKWFAIVPWVTLLALAALYPLAGRLSARVAPRKPSKGLPGFFPLPEHGLKFRDLAVAWVLLPLAAYFITFVPLLVLPDSNGATPGVLDLLGSLQWQIWDGQSRVLSGHPYASTWLQWPLLSRPIWYAFNPTPDGQAVRGVALIGNPLVLWGGLVAILWTLRDWLRTRSFAGLWILTAYLSMTLSWAVIPRKISFFYYYYPSAILLGFAWTYLLRRASEEPEPEDSPLAPLVLHLGVLAATLALFIYFWPILSAWKLPEGGYRRWMWFRSWI